MGGKGRRPASEEDVQADTEIDESDKAKALIEAAVGWFENDWQIDVIAGPQNAVCSGSVCFGVKEFAIERGNARDRVFVDSNQQVATANPGVLTWAARQNAMRDEAASGFEPDNTVGRCLVIAFLEKVQGRENDSGDGNKRQEHDGHPGLKIRLHDGFVQSGTSQPVQPDCHVDALRPG